MTPLDLFLLILAGGAALVIVLLLLGLLVVQPVIIAVLRERERIAIYGVTDKGQPAREERAR